jgi:hypothetical protein
MAMRLLYSELRKKSLLALAMCAVGVVGVGAGSAFAGEVKGPPGIPGEAGSSAEEFTAAPTHANSICAFSGLNDLNEEFGQVETRTQSPGTEHRLGNTPPGVPGEACKGFSNPRNPREKP